MWRRILLLAALGAGMSALILLAIKIGKDAPFEVSNAVPPLCALIGIGCGVAEIGWAARSRAGRTAPWIAGFALPLHVLLMAGAEPFAQARDKPEALIAIAWLLPAIVGGVVLPRLNCWLSGIGCCAVLVAGLAALAYSASHLYSTMDLFVLYMF